jgi:hypothetical protein
MAYNDAAEYPTYYHNDLGSDRTIVAAGTNVRVCALVVSNHTGWNVLDLEDGNGNIIQRVRMEGGSLNTQIFNIDVIADGLVFDGPASANMTATVTYHVV